MLLEIVKCFDDTIQNDPSISEAVAAIQTLLEVIKRSNGEFHIVSTLCSCYIFHLSFITMAFL